MLHHGQELEGYTVGATDGELGKVEDLYFDDGRWVIRYLIVETGGWLSRRKVLIAPRSVTSVTWDDGVINVSLTRQQVSDSPSIDTDKPVSRQHEIDYYNYYGYPNYWEGVKAWGVGMDPMPWVGASPDLASASKRPQDEALALEQQGRLDQERDSADSHLRSSKEVIGYEIMATDGPIGSVEAFMFDDESWAIRFMVVDTRKWLRGRHVLLLPEWIDHVSWSEHEVYVKVTRAVVETSPEYDPSLSLSRDDEEAVYAHHRLEERR